MHRTPSRLMFAIALTAAVIAGVMAGVAVGAPGLVERAASRALAAVESRFGVKLEAASVDWTWNGGVRASGVHAISRRGELLATIGDISIQSEVDLLARTLALRSLQLHDVAVQIEVRADGTTNLDGIIAGLAGRRDGSSTGAGAASRYLKPVAPEVAIEGLRIAARIAPERLPAGLAWPETIGLAGGRLSVRPVETPEGAGWRETRFDVALSFADTTIDPGHGFVASFVGGLAAGPSRFAMDFTRPVRVPFAKRLVALGGFGWDAADQGLRVRGLQLSEPFEAESAEVAAAVSVPELVVHPVDLQRFSSLASTRPGELRQHARALAEGIRRVELAAPSLRFSVADDGAHSFQDVMAHLKQLSGRDLSNGVPGEVSPDDLDAKPASGEKSPGIDAVGLSFAAARRALDDIGRGVGDGSNADPRIAQAMAKGAMKLDSLVERVLVKVDRATRSEGRALPDVAIRDGRLLVGVGPQRLALERVAIAIRHQADGRSVHVEAAVVPPNGDAASAGSIQLQLHPAGAVAEDRTSLPRLSARVRALPLAPLRGFAPIPETLLLPTEAAIIETLEVDLARLPPNAAGLVSGWKARGILAFSGLDVHLPVLTDAPMRKLDGHLAATVTHDPAQRLLAIENLELRRGDVAIRGGIDVADPLGRPKMRLDLHLPQVPVQKVFDAIPPEVVPLLEGLRMRGQLAWKLVVDFDTAVPAALRIDSRPNLSAFEVETLGTEIDFVRLHGAQAYRILLSDGSEGTRFVGPTTASWVPLEQIARWLPLALTTTEDGTFYTNDGISTFAIEESIIANLERGAFVRGASTITQQLVKNLYLGGSKKLGRKLQEIFLAWRLTQFMSKDRIMELYLNTIEFGPGIYGVGDAAWHWFGKRAADLDLAECIFLASIIPAPRKYHSFFEAGAVTPRWSAYLEMLLNVMVKREKITAEERDAAAPFAPRFRGQGAGSGDAAIFDTLPDRDAPNGDDAAPGDDDWDGDLLDGR